MLGGAHADECASVWLTVYCSFDLDALLTKGFLYIEWNDDECATASSGLNYSVK
jgi:hypothetical protein